METEEIFLVLAGFMLLFDLILLSKAKPREQGKPAKGFYIVVLASALIVTSYLILVQKFLSDDFIVKEVYYYSSSNLPITSKLYASWAGASGSMLFLTFLMAALYFAYRFKNYEKTTASSLTAYKLFDFTLLFLLIITLMNSPFQRFATAPIDGQGLNPLLQTFWMLVHPPVVFLGYALIIFATLIALANVSAQEKPRGRSFALLIQAAWLTTSVGIIIGGLWAYEVLGWGGYWAWDPVETASLLPWLALTAYFHLGPISKKGKSLASEFMLLVASACVIFATALTRGGLLVSVHTFESSLIGPVLLLFPLMMTVYFFYLRRKIGKPLFSFDVNKSSLYSVSLFTSFLSLIFVLLVSFWGVAFPIIGGALMSTSMNIGAEFFNNWNFPFVMAFVASLIGCSLNERINLRKFLVVVIGALIFGVILIQIRQPTPNSLANLGFPLLLVGLFGTIYKLAHVMPRNRRSFRMLGRSLLHLAIIITLLGVFFSATSKQVGSDVLAKPNTTVETMGLIVELKDFTVYPAVGNVHSLQYGQSVPEYSSLKIDVAIRQGGAVYTGALWLRLYALHGIVAFPLIITTQTSDIYIHMLETESIQNSLVESLYGRLVLPSDLIIKAEIIPAVYLVWAGGTLLCVSLAAPMVADLVRLARKKETPSKVTRNKS